MVRVVPSNGRQRWVNGSGRPTADLQSVDSMHESSSERVAKQTPPPPVPFSACFHRDSLECLCTTRHLGRIHPVSWTALDTSDEVLVVITNQEARSVRNVPKQSELPSSTCRTLAEIEINTAFAVLQRAQFGSEMQNLIYTLHTH